MRWRFLLLLGIRIVLLPGLVPVALAFSQPPGILESGLDAKPNGVARWVAARQLPTAIVELSALGLPPDLNPGAPASPVNPVSPGRRVPPRLTLADLERADLPEQAVPLPDAETRTGLNFRDRRFGRIEFTDGSTALFNPEIVLVKFKSARHVVAVRVEDGRELESVRTLAARGDVEFAELDLWQRRQFTPNDPLFGGQWHHGVMGSQAAWNFSRGSAPVRIAIVDTPFQMDHPDLAAHTIAGWDVVANTAVTNSTGIEHSTIGAGMAAAAINNATGVAGASDCSILALNINGAISEMYDAVIWAADHGVRVVSVSWTGADSATVNAAGAYLRTQAHGLLFMAGVNGSGILNYPNQPDIWCVSMTDAADNMRSRFGPHIDFAAPGYGVLSTTTGGGYDSQTGTSFATPLLAGVASVLMSINPALSSGEVIALLQTTAVDLGQPGWDMFFGWGRVNFGAAAAAAAATLPRITSLSLSNGAAVITVPWHPGWNYCLWRTTTLTNAGWEVVPGTLTTTNGTDLRLQDPQPPAAGAFYRVNSAP